MQDVITLYAPDWTLQESYGRIALELKAALEQLGVHVNAMGANAPKGTILPTWGGILLGYPTNFHQFGPMAMYGPRIALTMFESTVLPPGWTAVLNTCQAVIVPATWVETVFRRNGVTTPMTVAPLGISQAFEYHPRTPGQGKPYRFLAIADRGRRKGWHLAGFAFVRAFGERSDVQLTFKCREKSLPFTFTNPNIHLIAQDYSDAEMAALYQAHDCLVFPAAGEGFGWPPREFAATGGVAIATPFSGCADHIQQWGMPLDQYELVPAWPDDEKFRGLGVWASPDVDRLATLIQTVVENHSPTETYSQRVSAFVRETYRWDTFAQTVFATWQEAKAAYARNRNRTYTLSA